MKLRVAAPLLSAVLAGVPASYAQSGPTLQRSSIPLAGQPVGAGKTAAAFGSGIRPAGAVLRGLAGRPALAARAARAPARGPIGAGRTAAAPTAGARRAGSVAASRGIVAADGLAGRPLRSATANRIRRDVGALNPGLLASRVLSEANTARRRAGSRPLRTDARLASAARRYARELARREEIEHLSRTPGRRTFRDRIHSTGARARIAGENLARLTAAPERLPLRTIQAWMKSPGHRSNMLDPVFARTGVGVWLGDDGIWYVVQVYATTT